MTRAVIDTNIIVSALLQPVGPPAQVLLLALSGSLTFYITGALFTEYEEVIRRPRFRLGESVISAARAAIREKAVWV